MADRSNTMKYIDWITDVSKDIINYSELTGIPLADMPVDKNGKVTIEVIAEAAARLALKVSKRNSQEILEVIKQYEA